MKVEDFFFDYEEKQQEIMLVLHDLFVHDYRLAPKMRYDLPFYYGKSWICYLNPLKNHHVELAFTRGNELSKGQDLLESKGRKQVWSLEIDDPLSMPIYAIQKILQEAILLDEEVPYASKKSKR